jgi:transcription initiation factor TFIIIB Brf1 subunit/transcription initiation factor TFIIB
MQQFNSTIPPLNNNNLFSTEDANDIKYGNGNCEFSMYDDDEFENLGEKTLELSCDNWKICPDCNVQMTRLKNSFACEQCGRDKTVFESNGEYSNSIIDNYNTNKNCPQLMKLVGKKLYRYQKALWGTTSNYKAVQTMKTQQQLDQRNAQSKSMKFFPIILKEAANLYKQVQQHETRRKRGRGGALGSCIEFVCYRHGISKQPKEIAEYIGVEETYLSKGDKLLRKLQSTGDIDIPVHHDPKDDFILQYFELFSIDEKYKPFVSAVIDRASHTDMIRDSQNKISTQCTGTVYLLKMLLNLPFTKHDIAKQCKKSISTVVKYYDFLLRNRKKINAVCKKFNMPLLKRKKRKKKKLKIKKIEMIVPEIWCL